MQQVQLTNNSLLFQHIRVLHHTGLKQKINIELNLIDSCNGCDSKADQPVKNFQKNII